MDIELIVLGSRTGVETVHIDERRITICDLIKNHMSFDLKRRVKESLNSSKRKYTLAEGKGMIVTAYIAGLQGLAPDHMIRKPMWGYTRVVFAVDRQCNDRWADLSHLFTV
jgi:hypothetical protein